MDNTESYKHLASRSAGVHVQKPKQNNPPKQNKPEPQTKNPPNQAAPPPPPPKRTPDVRTPRGCCFKPTTIPGGGLEPRARVTHKAPGPEHAQNPPQTRTHTHTTPPRKSLLRHTHIPGPLPLWPPPPGQLDFCLSPAALHGGGVGVGVTRRALWSSFPGIATSGKRPLSPKSQTKN